MNPALQKRIAAIAGDRTSGASAILQEALSILQAALAGGEGVGEIARALCAAQPAMAPVWNAASIAEASASAGSPARFDRFARRVARAPAALARVAREHLLLGHPGGSPLRLATVSYSGSVLPVALELAATVAIEIACAEGRPRYEGRALAGRLAAGGVRVCMFTDAALASALDSCDAVLVGADAVGPEWFVNKVGTRMVATEASRQGVPLLVVASREKFVGAAGAASLTLSEDDPAEVWASPPAGVAVRNAIFERIPMDLVSGFLTDAGFLPASSVGAACDSAL